jgi:DNA-directed RNA polymerase subunit RPC12/RpoP
MMNGYREIEAPAELQPVTPCPDCGSRAVEPCLAPPGERERPIFLRCQACGSERADLDFYET